jgi:tetratricopeptide (TPR) repeat protein
MRIQRNRSRLTFRKRRSSGCLPLVVLTGMLVGVAALSWDWLGSRLNVNAFRSDNASLQAAQQAFAQGDLDKAVEQARTVFAADPEAVEALMLLTRALIFRSYSDYDHEIDRQLALELTTQALQRDPGHLDVLAIHAYALQANDQPLEAARMARQSLERQPDHVLARVALALSYGGVGGFETALKESQQAVNQAQVKRSPWLVDAQRALAISYSDLGEYTQAIQTVEKASALNNRLLPLYFERALYALQIGDVDAATVAYFQVMAYAPKNVKVRLRLCELSSTLREREAAIRYCTEVTELAPSWAEGWYHLGREYFLESNFQAAQEHFHRCSSLQVMQNVPVVERRFECWYLQGQAAEILGDCENLVATYNEFRAMTATVPVQQTWTYPPEGPPACVAASSQPTPIGQ